MNTRVLHTATLAILAAFLAAPLVAQEQPSRDDRTLLRAEGAPPNVLVVLDNAGSMTFDPILNQLNFPASGDHDELPLDTDKSIARWLARYYIAAGVDFSGITDNGSTPTEDEVTAYLENGAKLPQAREALQYLFEAYPEFNYGFTYFEKPALSIYYQSYLYEVLASDGSEGTPATAQGLMDGTRAGEPVRLGADYGVGANAQPDYSAPHPVFPARFGADGTGIIYFYNQNTDGSWWHLVYDHYYYWSPGDEPSSPTNGDRRLMQCLSDAAGTCLADLTAAERDAAGLYYYPAFRWSTLPTSIHDGLTGNSTWQQVAAFNWTDISAAAGITDSLDWSKPAHKLALRNWVVAQIVAGQFASRTLYITEREQVFQNTNRIWVNDPNGATRITPIGYRTRFVLYDSREHAEGQEGELNNQSLTALYNGGNMCGNIGSLSSTAGGFQDRATLDAGLSAGQLVPGETGAAVPLVPLSKPDPTTGETADRRSLISEYLRPQTTPLFYFPHTTATAKDLPRSFSSWLPFTREPVADDRRPLKSMLNEAELYFHMVNAWQDPERSCRLNFVVLISDGEETCTGGQANAVEVAARSLAQNENVSVFTVYFGVPNSRTNDIQTIADASGGEALVAKSKSDLIAAFGKIGAAIEERTRGFASPIVPSVETSSEQTAYISTFTPFQDRSIWRGHLRAYTVDPLTGVIKDLGPNGNPVPANANWDAGDILAERNADTRKMYYGTVNGSGAPVRAEFTYVGDGTGTTARTFLGNSIFYPNSFYDLSATSWGDTDPEKQDLSDVVNFIRGVQLDTSTGTFGRDPDMYGWCGDTSNFGVDADGNPIQQTYSKCSPVLGVEKLGDTFHGTPQMEGAPRCYACWLRNIHGYQDDLTNTGTNDGFYYRYQHRREVILATADDGSLHAFDGGLWDPDGGTITNADGTTTSIPPRYDMGSGRELFAWLPQATMQTLDNLTTGTEHWWTVDGTPTVADAWVHFGGTEQWRTLVLFGERRGGRSIVALDITNPDGSAPPDGDVTATVKGAGGIDPQSTNRDAVCLNGGAAGCGSAGNDEWPAFRFEFKDEVMVTETVTDPDGTTHPVTHPVPADEDNNGYPDLGNTWSRPLVAFVAVDDGNGGTVDHTVAFFGGGFTRDGLISADNHLSGNFLYALDLDTGTVLFKYQTAGMVPGDVAGVDLDLNGHLETLYWGDTAGYLYRMDLTEPATVSAATGRITNWTPSAFFYAGADQPFFMRPAVVPIAAGATGGQIVVAIGTGNRDDIFVPNATPNRFYAIVDPGNLATPESEANLYGPIYPSTTQSAAVNQNLLEAYGGWYLVLDDGGTTPRYEKVNTAAVVLNQQVIFSTFSPTENSTTTVTITLPDGTTKEVPLCSRRGSARTYTVDLYNANPPADADRFVQHPSPTAMATEPVVYVGADGKIHVIQALDNLYLEEPVGAMDVPVRVLSWKER